MPNLINIVKYVMLILLCHLGGHQICENILIPRNFTFSGGQSPMWVSFNVKIMRLCTQNGKLINFALNWFSHCIFNEAFPNFAPLQHRKSCVNMGKFGAVVLYEDLKNTR